MKLTAKARKAIPTKEFAGPDRSYPIEDASHARNALARVANKSPALKARVRAAIHRKYPNMGKKHEGNDGKSLHERGHHENHGKYDAPSHEEFHSLEDGKKDHMIGRDGKAGKVGYKGC